MTLKKSIILHFFSSFSWRKNFFSSKIEKLEGKSKMAKIRPYRRVKKFFLDFYEKLERKWSIFKKKFVEKS